MGSRLTPNAGPSRELKRSTSDWDSGPETKRRSTQALRATQEHSAEISPSIDVPLPLYVADQGIRPNKMFSRIESFASFDDADDHEFSDDDFDWNECVNEIDAWESRAHAEGSSSSANQDGKLAPRPETTFTQIPAASLARMEKLHAGTDAGITPLHSDEHLDPPGMVGLPIQGPRKCTCSCTCGALEYNRIMGFEPVPLRPAAGGEASRFPFSSKTSPAVHTSSTQSRSASAVAALAAAKASFQAPGSIQSRPGPTLSRTISSERPRQMSGSREKLPSAASSSKSHETKADDDVKYLDNKEPIGVATSGDPSVTDQAKVVAVKPPPSDGAAEPNLSSQQRAILEMVLKKQSLMFTGGAGTGKSVLARAIVRKLKEIYTWEGAVAVCALTGIAALHIGGQTIHSWAGVGLGNKPPEQLFKTIMKNKGARKRWLGAQVLLVDEVSMMDAVLFDKLEQLGRLVRGSDKPFGGIQLVLIGDFYQLPPVITAPTFFGRHDNQAKLKMEYQELCKTYKSRFLFDAKTWKECIPRTVLLRQVFRQADQTFVRMLEETRRGELQPSTIAQFHRLSRPLSVEDGIYPTELYSTRNQVADANLSRLKALPGKAYRYESRDQSFVHSRQQEYPIRFHNGGEENSHAQIKEYLDKRSMAPAVVELKEGAQVMLIKNLINGLVNGSRGIVTGFMDTSEVRLAQQHNGRCFFSDPTAEPVAKLVKRKVRKVRRVYTSDATEPEVCRTAVPSEDPVLAQGGAVKARCLIGDSPDVIVLEAGAQQDAACDPNAVGPMPEEDESDWTYEEYETEEEVVEEQEPARIELAVASGNHSVDDRSNDRSSLNAFMRRRAPASPPPRGADPGLEYAVPGIKYPLVRFVDGQTLLMVPLKFDVESLVGGSEASRVQVPLILAWSMSIHKAQGQTLDKCKVNLSRVFEKAQAYVALSRARSLEGLQVEGFDPNKVRTDPLVLEWEKEVLAGPDWLAGAALQEAKAKAKAEAEAEATAKGKVEAVAKARTEAKAQAEDRAKARASAGQGPVQKIFVVSDEDD